MTYTVGRGGISLKPAGKPKPKRTKRSASQRGSRSKRTTSLTGGSGIPLADLLKGRRDSVSRALARPPKPIRQRDLDRAVTNWMRRR